MIKKQFFIPSFSENDSIMLEYGQSLLMFTVANVYIILCMRLVSFNYLTICIFKLEVQVSWA